MSERKLARSSDQVRLPLDIGESHETMCEVVDAQGKLVFTIHTHVGFPALPTAKTIIRLLNAEGESAG